jgi:superfamily II DNA or RNA helicase
MLKDVEWSIDRDYKTDGDNEPLQFYLDGLNNSKQFDLLLGYFSSAAISLLSLGFATFLSKGGKVRLIINHILSEADKNAIEMGIQKNTNNVYFDITDVNKLRTILDGYDKHFFECLAWLIANKKIELKVIKPKGGKGISHYKSGMFYDSENIVGYKASCNFTLFGLSENLEELEAFLSWENGRSNKLINKQKNKFEEYFKEEDNNVDYIKVEDIEVAIKDSFGGKDMNELIVQEKELLKKKSISFSSPKLKKTIQTIIDELDKSLNLPKFPYKEGPREYQIEAYEKWLANNRKGIFSMATGTGKTITSLNCLLNEFRIHNSYKAIIIVPTIALIEQWKKECLKFNFKNIITVSSKENWNDNLAFVNTSNKIIDISFIVIVTYSSLIRPKFQSHFKLLPPETLLIADEAHNLGAPNISKLLNSIHLKNRIGLSATINRKYDDEGNISIENFFHDKHPYIYSYSMKQALDINWLCKYKYYPHVVYLIDFELEEYIKISKQLMVYLDPKTGKYKDCKEVENLLLKRKRIIHKARNKKNKFKNILDQEFKSRNNLKYTLIYVPEGVDPDYSKSDDFIEDEDDFSLINDYTKIVSETDNSIMVKQYTSKSSNRNDIIKDFELGNVHVLTSMKCLDEGVDVPRAELAIFCSSTGNPRQFIQRRGRVLRLHHDKIISIIHDLVVIPKIEKNENNYDMERNLIKKELERVVDFSELSINKIDTFNELKEILDYYNLNLNDFINE